MQLNQKKLARQKICFAKMLSRYKSPVTVTIDNIAFAVRAAIIVAVTGFGKTFIAIMAILDMNNRHPDRTTIVIVPTTKLKDDWTRDKQVFDDNGKLVLDFGHINKHGLINVQVFVVNTYVKYTGWSCDFLILDEAHHYASLDAKFFSTVVKITKFKYGLALSATLNEKQEEFFESLGWEVVDRINEEEAEREGYTSRSTVYNLGIPLSVEGKKFNNEVNTLFNNLFAKFNFDFDLIKGCNAGEHVKVSLKLKGSPVYISKTGREWRQYWATKRGYTGDTGHPYSPSNISKYAAQAMHAMARRKKMWQNHPDKLPVVKELINLFPDVKTLIFSESAVFADKVTELLGKSALSYHTKLKTLAYREGHSEVVELEVGENRIPFKEAGYTIKGPTLRRREALEAFFSTDGEVKQLSTVKAVDEGLDYDKIGLIIKIAYNSTVRQKIQRDGRGKRVDYEDLDKHTIIVNLYMIGTQEQKWLEAAQVNSSRFVRYITSVSEIQLKSISLYAEPEESTTIEVGTISYSPGRDGVQTGGIGKKFEADL